jgi:UrcA family protein
MKTILILAAAASVLAAGLSAPAQAESPAFETRSAVVNVSELDLSSEAGVRALDRRIGAAARHACGIPSSADPEGLRKAKACRADAIQSAAEQRSRAISAARARSSATASAR